MNKLMNFGFREILRDAGDEGRQAADAAAVAAAAQKVADDAAAAAAQKLTDYAAAALVAANALADKDGTPEARAAAKEKADLLRDVMDQNTKLLASQEEAKTAKAALAAYGGVDPVKVAALIKKEADAEKDALAAKGEFDSVKKMMAEEHARDMKEISDKLDAERLINSGNTKLIDDLTIGAAFSTSKFIADNLIISHTKARILYGTHFEMVDGKVVGYDKPKGDASRTMLVTASGDAMPFETAFERLFSVDPDKKEMTKAKLMPGSSSSTTPKPNASQIAPKQEGVFGASRIALSLSKDVK